MRYDIAIEAFRKLASEMVAELEQAVASGDERYYNADIALRNVGEWLRKLPQSVDTP